MKMTLQQKIEKAKSKGIYLPVNLFKGRIVGVYGIFAIKKDKEFCIYVGKATNLCDRMLKSSNGHIHCFLYNRLNKLVPRRISEWISKGYNIEVRILEEVDYHDSSFSRATHRLALAELKHIVKYQESDQCLDQLPEGIGTNEEKYWKENYWKENYETIER